MTENIIPRKYNYNLETGTVGTDDDDMANILYNINCMEMKASYESDDVNDMQTTFGESFSMVTEAAEHLDNFIENHKEKLRSDTIDDAELFLSEAVVILDDVEPPQTDIELMSNSIKAAYQKMLDAVPSLLKLDEQAI
ncbi:MAG: hypothetical protein IJ752_09680 [Alphaproteobacteria bacterium]|nr:hypothetical protein [Alphaproteobacteria bacterium]